MLKKKGDLPCVKIFFLGCQIGTLVVADCGDVRGNACYCAVVF